MTRRSIACFVLYLIIAVGLVACGDGGGASSSSANNNNGNTGSTITDTIPPTIPTSLLASAISSTQISLSWSTSTDDMGVTGYKIYRNSTYISTPTTTALLDSGLTASTNYCYTVSAIDSANNESGQSNEACAITSSVLPSGSSFSRASNVTTIAGALGASGSLDGTGSAARFNDPQAITTDGANLYIADTENFTVRKIVITTGEVTTLAGSAGLYGSTDGIGTDARFYDVGGIATDGTNLYVADTTNCVIRKIVIATRQVSTLAGTTSYLGGSLWTHCSYTDGTGSAARFNSPQGLATDGTNLYVADTWNDLIRKIVLATGEVTTLAGTAGSSGSADGIGAVARFNNPQGITLNGTDLYVADSTNYTVRKVDTITGQVTTVAGIAGVWGATDGVGGVAKFGVVRGITTDGKYLYVTDSSNQMIRKISITTREVSTIAGMQFSSITSTVDGTGTNATFGYPLGITTDGSRLYITDSSANTIRRIQ